jgi:hypothetical protein
VAYKGRFKPKNPEKYKGDPTKIIYRSSWELHYFRWLDKHPDVVEWSSEEVIVWYVSPIDKKPHRYFPDCVVKKRVGDNKYETVMIEIKPFKQTRPPDPANKNKTKTGRVSRRYLNEVKTYAVNEAKWNYAEEYCKKRGWSFIKLTEKDLGIVGK